MNSFSKLLTKISLEFFKLSTFFESKELIIKATNNKLPIKIGNTELKTIFEQFVDAVIKAEEHGIVQGTKLAFHELLKLGSEILVPFFIGGAIIGSILAVIGYFTAYGIITHHRVKKDLRLKKKLAKKNSEFMIA